MTRVMYFDAFSGAAGDMVLGALLDAGLPLDRLREALGTLGVEHELRVTRVLRAGISATHVQVVESQSDARGDKDEHTHADAPSASHEHHDHDHDHGHHHHDHGHKHGAPQAAGAHTDRHHHDHRSVAEIARLIGQSALSETGKARAVSMFQRLAEAEAAIHDLPVEKVHLHEVGAVDSIIDIVGAVFGLEWFGIEQIIASPLNVGGGTVEMAHGMFPIPAPATLRLLAGIPMYSNGVMTELVTPTGALIISDYAKSYGPMPAMKMERAGYGAGTRDFGKVPNVLRIVIGELSAEETTTAAAFAEAVLKVECEIDDMNPQLFGPVTDQLFAAGALDVFLTPIVMKKGRPGTLLTVLAPLEGREAISRVLFRETTTIGVRFEALERETLDREWVEVAVDGRSVRIKVAHRHGEIMNAAPEFDDCLRVATSTGRAIKLVQAEAMRAWLEKSQTPRDR